MSERISVKDAAAVLGCNPQAVRENMKSGRWDLGSVVPTGKTGRKYTYYIYKEKLNKHIGRIS